jgi:SAM-dependent methyltransferase
LFSSATVNPTPHACPRTHRPLTREGDVLVGPAGERYPIADGIPSFLAYPPEDDPNLPAIRQALARVPEVGWRRALQETASDPALKYVTASCRTSYVDLLPIGPTTRVLEVGCSLGQGTAALARVAGRVEAVEVVPEQAAFTALRLREEGLHNASVCVGGDDCRLPFAAGQFDLAVLNLVLEWCGQRDPGSFEEAQRRMLAELGRTLRPGGVVYVATKNRYALNYLTGGGDEHASGLPFGNALPRSVLALALRATGRPPARGVLHSHAALRGMLEDAGFGAVRGYWAAPDARYPAAYVPAEAATVRAARASLAPKAIGHTRRVRKLLPWVPASLLVHVAPSIVFTAVRGAAAPQRHAA